MFKSLVHYFVHGILHADTMLQWECVCLESLATAASTPLDGLQIQEFELLGNGWLFLRGLVFYLHTLFKGILHFECFRPSQRVPDLIGHKELLF